jgi:hypothetical protein
VHRFTVNRRQPRTAIAGPTSADSVHRSTVSSVSSTCTAAAPARTVSPCSVSAPPRTMSTGQSPPVPSSTTSPPSCARMVSLRSTSSNVSA